MVSHEFRIFFKKKTFFSTLVSKLFEFLCGNHYFGSYSYPKFAILRLYARAQPHYITAGACTTYLDSFYGDNNFKIQIQFFILLFIALIHIMNNLTVNIINILY